MSGFSHISEFLDNPHANLIAFGVIGVLCCLCVYCAYIYVKGR